MTPTSASFSPAFILKLIFLIVSFSALGYLKLTFLNSISMFSFGAEIPLPRFLEEGIFSVFLISFIFKSYFVSSVIFSDSPVRVPESDVIAEKYIVKSPTVMAFLENIIIR